jgi:hypothetical protein
LAGATAVDPAVFVAAVDAELMFPPEWFNPYDSHRIVFCRGWQSQGSHRPRMSSSA